VVFLYSISCILTKVILLTISMTVWYIKTSCTISDCNTSILIYKILNTHTNTSIQRHTCLQDLITPIAHKQTAAETAPSLAAPSTHACISRPRLCLIASSSRINVHKPRSGQRRHHARAIVAAGGGGGGEQDGGGGQGGLPQAQGLVLAAALLRSRRARLHVRVRDAVEELGLLARSVPPAGVK
jgi:hypothetical protein